MTGTRRQRIECEESGDATITTFIDRRIVDEQLIQFIGDDLFRLVDELGRRKIVLSFQGVILFSSACLGKLITLNRKIQAVRGRLALCEIEDASITETFVITKLHKLFTIVKTREEALAHCRS